MPNHIWLNFGNGVYLAHLKNKRIDAVESVTGASLGDINARSMSGVYRDTDGAWIVLPSEAKWSNKELVEIVRQGFIGGGKAIIDGVEKPINDFQVNDAISHYLDERPRVELWKLAAAILHATMEGYEPGEAEGAKPPAPEAGKASLDPKATLDT
jgi:hypothetical protein